MEHVRNSSHLEKDIEDLLRRHKNFWARGAADQALVGRGRRKYFPTEDFKLEWDQVDIQPELYDPEYFLPQYEKKFSSGGLYIGDLLWSACPFWGIPWMEAIIGCPIRIQETSKTFWAAPIFSDLREIPDISLSLQNTWFQKLLESVKVLAENSKGRFPISMPLMRGPVDMLEALMGVEKLCLGAIDYPERVRELADQCADVYIAVAQAQLGLIPSFYGGYSNFRQIWAPGWTSSVQQLAAVLFKPEMYREILLTADIKIIESFDYTIMHQNSNSLHLLDDLLGIEKLSCIQILVDPVGPSLEDLLPSFLKVQDYKTLVILGDFDQEDLDYILETLSPRGLCVYIQRHSV